MVGVILTQVVLVSVTLVEAEVHPLRVVIEAEVHPLRVVIEAEVHPLEVVIEAEVHLPGAIFVEEVHPPGVIIVAEAHPPVVVLAHDHTVTFVDQRKVIADLEHTRLDQEETTGVDPLTEERIEKRLLGRRARSAALRPFNLRRN